MTDRRSDLGPREILLAIDATQAQAESYTKEDALKLLRIAAGSLSQLMASNILAMEAALADKLKDVKPKGSA